MQRLVHALLCKRQRRIQVIALWHSKAIPFDGETNLFKIVYKFINVILYAPLQISMHADYFYVFRELRIPYSFLTTFEREIAKDLYLNRSEHFQSCEFYVNNYKLDRCRENVVLPVLNRREIVRDFVGLLQSRRYRYVVLYVVQWILVERKDPFVLDLHEVAQGRLPIANLVCAPVEFTTGSEQERLTKT